LYDAKIGTSSETALDLHHGIVLTNVKGWLADGSTPQSLRSNHLTGTLC
jgi:hypothetical protein